MEKKVDPSRLRVTDMLFFVSLLSILACTRQTRNTYTDIIGKPLDQIFGPAIGNLDLGPTYYRSRYTCRPEVIHLISKAQRGLIDPLQESLAPLYWSVHLFQAQIFQALLLCSPITLDHLPDDLIQLTFQNPSFAQTDFPCLDVLLSIFDGPQERERIFKLAIVDYVTGGQDPDPSQALYKLVREGSLDHRTGVNDFLDVQKKAPNAFYALLKAFFSLPAVKTFDLYQLNSVHEVFGTALECFSEESQRTWLPLCHLLAREDQFELLRKSSIDLLSHPVFIHANVKEALKNSNGEYLLYIQNLLVASKENLPMKSALALSDAISLDQLISLFDESIALGDTELLMSCIYSRRLPQRQLLKLVRLEHGSIYGLDQEIDALYGNVDVSLFHELLEGFDWKPTELHLDHKLCCGLNSELSKIYLEYSPITTFKPMKAFRTVIKMARVTARPSFPTSPKLLAALPICTRAICSGDIPECWYTIISQMAHSGEIETSEEFLMFAAQHRNPQFLQACLTNADHSLLTDEFIKTINLKKSILGYPPTMTHSYDKHYELSAMLTVVAEKFNDSVEAKRRVFEAIWIDFLQTTYNFDGKRSYDEQSLVHLFKLDFLDYKNEMSRIVRIMQKYHRTFSHIAPFLFSSPSFQSVNLYEHGNSFLEPFFKYQKDHDPKHLLLFKLVFRWDTVEYLRKCHRSGDTVLMDKILGVSELLSLFGLAEAIANYEMGYEEFTEEFLYSATQAMHRPLITSILQALCPSLSTTHLQNLWGIAIQTEKLPLILSISTAHRLPHHHYHTLALTASPRLQRHFSDIDEAAGPVQFDDVFEEGGHNLILGFVMGHSIKRVIPFMGRIGPLALIKLLTRKM